jgi:glycosyltransferase involved in cell wall biosynthesis
LFAAFVGACRILAPVGTVRGRLLDRVLSALVDGLDWLYVRGGKHARGQQSTPAESVEDIPPEPESDPVHVRINAPSPGASVRVMTLLWGWALDQTSPRGTGITALRIFLDGYLKGTATYGITRHDVSDQFGPQFKDCGWEFALDLQSVSPGHHTIQVAAYSSVSGRETTASLPLLVEAPVRREGVRFALFISSTPGDPKRYRCDHQAQQLQLLGLTADVAVYSEVQLGDVVDQYQVFVLHRVLLSQDIAWFMDEVRRRGRVLIYDTDDLIFDVEATRFIAAFGQMTERDREKFLDWVSRGRQALVRCDAVIVSTEPLRDPVQQIHHRVVVNPNVADRAMVEQAALVLSQTASPEQKTHPDHMTIAYLSGTPTHDSDFRHIADDVIWALETYPTTRLMTVGPLMLDSRFERFADRIEQVALRPWRELFELIRGIDINLAPLEPENPFTDAKSCIKFLESALVAVPTIASSNPDFGRAIVDGVTGFIANDTAEWRSALARLIESQELRRQIGERARQDVLQRFTTATAAPSVLAIWRDLVSVTTTDEPLTINWIVRQVSGDNGQPFAPHVVLRLAGYLANRGHHVRLLTAPRIGGVGLLRGEPVAIESSMADSQPWPVADVDIATDGPTARLVATHGCSPCRANFIQDASVVSSGQPIHAALRAVCWGRSVANSVARTTSSPTTVIDPPEGEDDQAWATAGGQLENVLLEMAFAERICVSQPEALAGASC